MKILIPLGLIALIAIPIIIIIYIIKPRYVEKKISSTYIWQKSLKYKKKKNPFSWLTRSLLLIVQILAASTLAFLIAYPVIQQETTVKDTVVILDASSSMNAISDGQTRFDKAKNQVKKLAGSVNNYNRMSLILANDYPTTLFQYETNKNNISNIISGVNPSFGTSNIEDALILANEIQENNTNCDVYLISDHEYEHHGYVHLINVSNNEFNLALSDFNYAIIDGYYAFTVNVASYNKPANFKLQLDINSGFKYKTLDVTLNKDESRLITIDDLGLTNCKNATVRALTRESANKDFTYVDDAYVYDNEISIFDIEKDKQKVLLVGDAVTFYQAAILAIGKCDLYGCSTTAENIPNSGYDLYIYDNYYPEVFPSDGEIIISNPKGSSDALNIQKKAEIETDAYLEATFSNTEVYQKLMRNVSIGSVNVTKYTQLNLLSNFEVMATCNGSPIFIAGNINKAKLLILAFDLHYSDLPLSANMIFIVKNMLDYSLVDTISNTNPNIYDSISIHSKITTVETTVDGELIYNENNSNNDYVYDCASLGRHEVVQTLNNGKTITNYFFVNHIKEEGVFNIVSDFLAPDTYTRTNTNPNPKGSINYDLVIILSFVLLALVSVEWWLSINEQY